MNAPLKIGLATVLGMSIGFLIGAGAATAPANAWSIPCEALDRATFEQGLANSQQERIGAGFAPPKDFLIEQFVNRRTRNWTLTFTDPNVPGYVCGLSFGHSWNFLG